MESGTVYDDDFHSTPNALYIINTTIPDDVWRVLEVTEFLKNYNNRVYLTVDDAINAVTIESQVKQVVEKAVSIIILMKTSY